MARSNVTARPNSYVRDRDTGSDAAAFEEIVRIAQAHSHGPSVSTRPTSGKGRALDIGCRIKTLPPRLATQAAQHAARVNRMNAPVLEGIKLPPGIAPPLALAVVTTKYWGYPAREFTVSFMESAPSDIRAHILEHMNAWAARINKTFVETEEMGEVRISFGPGGYFSYLGTDIGLIPDGQQTMNLEGFDSYMPESEYLRVVRHETGHTLGFPHEHMRSELVARIDPEKAYPYFWETQGWVQTMVDEQVLTPLDDATIYGTPPDEDSIMCYQLPGEITYDGLPIRGGTDINETDYEFAAELYPQSSSAPKKKGKSKMRADEGDWGPANDVKLRY
jgi:hypothetical protein